MGNRFLSLLVVLVLTLGPMAQIGASEGQGADRGPGFHEDSAVWTDSFDDLSHVYIPAAGLVRMEVSGGQAQLKAGENTGWIASSVISAKPGMKYDYVFIDADTPGASYINITIVNASAESLEVGFVNRTIDGFRLKAGPYLSVLPLNWRVYPDIRIQVNLVADGADRPVLYAWSFFYLDLEAWKDDFLWPGRMSDQKGLNFTDGNLEVNLTSLGGSGGGGDYEEFPTIACSGGSGGPDVYYANTQRDDYEDRTTVGIGGWSNSMAVDDLNNDDYFDLVVQMWVGRVRILWGDDTGTWSQTGATTLNPSNPSETTTGDFNGDGDVDIAVACRSGGADNSFVYLNQGDGSFVDNADVTMAMDATRVSTGDLDGDTYDDILFTDSDNAKVFMGSEDGPDNLADITFSTSNCGDTLIKDVDGDGHLDVILGENNGGKASIYLGSRDGPDTTADFLLSVPDDVTTCEAGDVNGDGYTDVLFYSGSGSNYHLYIFEGASQGWSDSRRHGDITHNNNGDALDTADLDKDGYDDIMQVQSLGGNEYRLKIWLGSSSWPSAPDIVKTGGYDNSVAAVIPKDAGGIRAYRGTFTTEPIDLPQTKPMKWDMLDLVGTMPKNTTMTLSVLDHASGDPIKYYEDLTEWNVDLSRINSSNHRTIQVEVTITSEFNTTTPVLDRLMVKWMDSRVWRDEFYGAGKADRLLGLDVAVGQLQAATLGGAGPQLIFPAIMGDDDFTTMPKAYFDAGGMDYLSTPPIEFGTRGTSAVAVADVNHDGYMDAVFAVHRIAHGVYGSESPLFLGGPFGLEEQPSHLFDTTGAMDVLLRDLDDDGHMDVVFAQERKGDDDYVINSTLYWGSADGWADTPDVEFNTTGASDVEAVDLDDDGLMDLVFACFRSPSSTTDSLVFMQNATGFNGTSPSLRLATEGARAVASGDLDGDTFMDLVFANSFSRGSAEVDSSIYWGKSGGGFESATTDLPTKGARDVKVADLDGDTDLDIVFANYWDNSQDYEVDSAVYLNDGSGVFSSSPDALLPTSGATGVAIADLDGTGWMDLVFSCERGAGTFGVPSVVYLGGTSGWSGTPDISIPTEGASDVMVAHLYKHGTGGYMSVPIMLDEIPRDTGTVHTLRYTASMGPSISGKLRLVDRGDMEVLAETLLRSGTNEWDVQDLFRVSEHRSIRIIVVITGLESLETFSLDDLWLNWTQRVLVPPRVLDVGFSEGTVYRLGSVDMWLNATDSYDPSGRLTIDVQHRINGTDTWETYLVGTLSYVEATDTWRTVIIPKVNAPAGVYDFRVTATDLDGQHSEWVEVPLVLEVLNNLPTAPEIRLEPANPVSTSTLRVEIVTPSTDLESVGISYHYRWYKDGELQENLTADNVPSFYTSRYQNWSVDVRAFDGDDESSPALAWRRIENAGPGIKNHLPDPEIDEDTPDSNWLDLTDAFEDADGDKLTWTLKEVPQHIQVTIDPDTGQVTLTPESDWHGWENITFVASDGESSVSQEVMVRVLPVNDIPWIATVDGKPVTTDPVVYTVKQGEVLMIYITTSDVEGDEVQMTVNNSVIEFDEEAGTIRFEPGNDAVGTFRFGLKINDINPPWVKVSLNFTIIVEDENDEMEDPRITSPTAGDRAKVNDSLIFSAYCDDPDIQYGQVLNFTWSSNMSGVLGYGPRLEVPIMDAGTHLITVTVRDPDFEKTDTIEIYIEPLGNGGPIDPPDDDDETKDGPNYLLIVGIIAVLGILGAVLFVVVGKRSTEAYEAKMDARMDEEEKQESLKRAHEAIKDLADEWEGEAKAEAAGWEAEGKEYEEVKMDTPRSQLSMEAKVTEGPSGDVAKLWSGISETEVEKSEEEKEALRLDNLKRKYQNAIGRLPYGIPSKELQDMDWVVLANALATGERKQVEGGKEVTLVKGRWYYSDHEDTGTFLKEHGAKPKEAPKRAAGPATDKEVLLAKLEERFILGEISEETYKELQRKYEG